MNDKPKSYYPLFIVVMLAFVMSLANHANIDFFFFAVMNSLIGFFFCLLSMFKLFDLSAFTDGFAMYDIIAKRWRPYGFIYPFIELGLGLLYLAMITPLITNVIALVVMIMSAVGVIMSITAGMNLRCACLGTVLNVPLSTVSIVENLGMGAMAAINIIALLST